MPLYFLAANDCRENFGGSCLGASAAYYTFSTFCSAAAVLMLMFVDELNALGCRYVIFRFEPFICVL